MRSSKRITLCGTLLLLTAVAAAAVAPPLSVHDIARLRTVLSVSISPDGEQTAYRLQVPRDPFFEEDGAAWVELHVVDVEGNSRAFVTGEVNVGHVQWLPDGSAISFLAKRGDDEHNALYVIPANGGEARRVLGHAEDIAEYAWSPDGKRIAFLAKAARGEEEEEMADKGFNQEIFEEEWRPVQVWVADLEGEEPSALGLQGSASELHWSPAGDRLAVALAPTSLIDDGYMRRRVHVVDVANGAVVSRLENPGKLGAVRWSPHGRYLALVSGADLNDPKEGRLLVAEATTGKMRELLPDYAGHVNAIAWQDDDHVVFVGDEGVQTVVRSVPAAGGDAVTLVPPGGAVWRTLSAGGGKIALLGDSPEHPSDVFHLAGGKSPSRLTDSNPWLVGRQLARQEVVRYKARDGLELEGLLIRPLDEEAGAKYPLVLVVHGGPEAHYRNGWLTNYSRPGQALAARGIAAFYPNYRGSTGRGVEFSKLSQGDPAGKEFDDLVDAVDHLIADGLVDGDKVAITGGSYGGYATAWGSTYYTDRFAAGVMFVGISNEISKIGTSDIPNELYLVHTRHWPWDDWQLMLERSPIYYVEQARTPLLILHGKDDPRVFRGQSMELHRFLKILGNTPVRLVLYPGEKHGNARAASRLDYSLRAMRWIEHYLKGPAGDPPPYALEYEGPDEDEEAVTVSPMKARG